MKLFAQLAKYDETTGYFEAIAADESVDKASEIFDYATSKPYFQAWSETVSKASNGKSAGNVRAMHGKVAAGKLTAIEFDDDAKAIKVAGLVVDPVEKTKMATGVYTGVSIGGKYVGAAWEDPVIKGAMRYTADPSEISIVDYPCNGNAFFTVVKDGGVEELRKLHSVDDAPVEKGMFHVAQLAMMLKEIGYMTQDQYDEAAREGDGSTVPAALESWLQQGAALLVSMAAEEGAEIVATSTPTADVPAIALAAGDELGKTTAMVVKIDATEAVADINDALEKVGAKHSKATVQHHECIKTAAQTILDHCAALSGVDPSKAAEDEIDKVEGGELAKADLEKIVAERDAALEKVAELTAEVDALKAVPVPPKAAALSVSKTEDTTTSDPVAEVRKQVESLEGEDKVRALIKLAHMAPV